MLLTFRSLALSLFLCKIFHLKYIRLPTQEPSSSFLPRLAQSYKVMSFDNKRGLGAYIVSAQNCEPGYLHLHGILASRLNLAFVALFVLENYFWKCQNFGGTSPHSTPIA